MPEIAEVARIVSRLRNSLVGKTISSITVFEDSIVYKETTHNAFKTALEGKKVVAAKQWGKYFWLVMESSPHPLLHFGMSGWIYIKNDPGAHYRISTEESIWPPKHIKFNLKLSNGDEIAFTDARRLGRIRLIDHPTGDLRSLSPLAENGPDPVLEPVSVVWLTEKLEKRKMPVKSWLLDQSVIAGIGNWVADEILYHARIHPEQHTNTLSTKQIASLHEALGYVTKLAVDVEADSSKFPENWLMVHRWGKGKGDVNKLPTGEKIDFVKVGSRTSAFVPSLQKMPKKGGDEAEEEEDENDGGGVEVKKPAKKSAPKKATKKSVKKDEDGDNEVEGEKPAKKSVPKKATKKSVKKDEDGDSELEEEKPAKKSAPKKPTKKSAKKEEDGDSEVEEEKSAPRRRAPARSAKKAVKKEETDEDEEESEPESPKPRKRKAVAKTKAQPKRSKR